MNIKTLTILLTFLSSTVFACGGGATPDSPSEENVFP